MPHFPGFRSNPPTRHHPAVPSHRGNCRPVALALEALPVCELLGSVGQGPAALQGCPWEGGASQLFHSTAPLIFAKPLFLAA